MIGVQVFPDAFLVIQVAVLCFRCIDKCFTWCTGFAFRSTFFNRNFELLDYISVTISCMPLESRNWSGFVKFTLISGINIVSIELCIYNSTYWATFYELIDIVWLLDIYIYITLYSCAQLYGTFELLILKYRIIATYRDPPPMLLQCYITLFYLSER